MELLFRGTKDGMSADVFHNKYNNKGQTITLIKNEKGYIFGGFASIDWASCGGWRSSPNNFLFTLMNKYEIAPTKFPNTDTNYSMYDYYTCGPYFGSAPDIYINFPNNISTSFPASYNDVTGKNIQFLQEIIIILIPI